MKLFADDVIIYKEIISPADAVLLQLDLSKVVQWAKKWLLRLNPDKCESIVLSNKRSPIIIWMLNLSPPSLLFVTWAFLLIGI